MTTTLTRATPKVCLSTPEQTREGSGYKIVMFGPTKGAEHVETRYEGHGEDIKTAVCDLMANIRRRNPGILLDACRQLAISYPEVVR